MPRTKPLCYSYKVVPLPIWIGIPLCSSVLNFVLYHIMNNLGHLLYIIICRKKRA